MADATAAGKCNGTLAVAAATAAAAAAAAAALAAACIGGSRPAIMSSTAHCATGLFLLHQHAELLPT